MSDNSVSIPSVTIADITNSIANEQFFNLTGTLTICVLTMKNGFMVTGESACASPELYNKELGEKIARENAVKKIWPLLGYVLKESLFKEKYSPQTETRTAYIDRMIQEKEELIQKLEKLNAFLTSEKCQALDIDDYADLIDQRGWMYGYKMILETRIQKARLREGLL